MPEASTSAILDAEAVLELDLEGFKLIEASAGTGKTHTIADLYLRHILGGRQPSQILIVTYTNAATEELRGRILVQRQPYEFIFTFTRGRIPVLAPVPTSERLVHRSLRICL